MFLLFFFVRMFCFSKVMNIKKTTGKKRTTNKKTQVVFVKILSCFEKKKEISMEDVIPKIIHQTWKTSDVPLHWQESETKWREFATMYNYEYRLWTDDDILTFIKQEYPWFEATFTAFPHNIQRADAMRYFVLYHFGGVYCDLDFSPKLHEMHCLLEYYRQLNVSVALAKSSTATNFTKHGQILTNAFMISKKGAPFWQYVWPLMSLPLTDSTRPFIHRISHKIPYFQIIFGTGPGAINEAVARYHRAPNSATFPVIAQIPCEYISCCKAWERKPFQTQISAVRVLEGSSWHNKSMQIYPVLNRVVHHQNLISGISVAVLGILLLICVICLARKNRQLKKLKQSPIMSKSNAIIGVEKTNDTKC